METSIFRTIRLAAVTLTCIFLAGLAPALGADTDKDQAAVVNGVVITRQEMASEITLAKKRMAAQGHPVGEEAEKKLSRQILDQLIDMEILFQESRKEKIQIDDKVVSTNLEGFKKRFPSLEEYQKALSELNVSEADLKEKTKKGLAVQQLIEKQVTAKIKISDADSHNFYDRNPQFFQQPEQVAARHILIKTTPKDDKATQDKALAKIKEIQVKVKAGEDFAELAKKYSEGPSGKNGGDLGYFGRGQMVKPFEDAAFSLAPDQTSDIVKTQFGYHLIKVTGKKAAETVPFDKVKEKISAHLKQQKTNESIRAYIETLKKDAKIKKSL